MEILSDSLATWVAVFILGTVLGSFANVCVRRIPAGVSVVSPRSRCESCGGPVRFPRNVPVLSWIFLMGRCADCGARISIEYPAVEILSGFLAVAVYGKFGPGIEFVFHMAFSLSLVVVTLIDARHMVIPDSITLPGTAAGLVLGALKTDWEFFAQELSSRGFADFPAMVANVEILDSLAGAALGGGTFFLIARAYRAIRKTEGMGMGDVKLISMLGAFLGTWGVVVVIFLSSVMGTLAGVALIAFRARDVRHPIPYGPFLSAAALVYLLFEDGVSFLPVATRALFW